MATKKRTASQEPLLNTVARTLGHAAGTFTKATQGFTESLSSLPDAVTAKVREAANLAMPANNARRARPKAKKKTRPATRRKRAKSKVVAKKPSGRKKPLSRNKRKPRGKIKRSR